MTVNIETIKPALNELPENYLIEINDFSAISLAGEEQSKYLQGQVTCDVNALTNNTFLHGAHCNAKGKVFSCFRLFNRNDTHLLFQPKSTISDSLAELKKFGVFAKVNITTTDSLAFYALVGDQAPTLLKNKFAQVPDSLTPVVQVDSTSLVYLSGNIDRYLIIDEQSKLPEIVNSFSLPVYNSAIWTLLEIKEGFPHLSIASDHEYVPQMLNMQAIHGISFKKGCYLGQETVARMQYLGKNKKALFAFNGQISTPISQTIIEKQLGENWRKAGDITSIYQADNGECYVQAVLANDIDKATKLRIKDLPESALSLVDLPYSLNQES